MADIPDSILEIKKKTPKPKTKKPKKPKQKKVGETCSGDSECKGKGCCSNGVCEKGSSKACKAKVAPKKKSPAKKEKKPKKTSESIKKEIEELRKNIIDTEDKKKEAKYIKKLEKLTKKLTKLEKKSVPKKKKSPPKKKSSPGKLDATIIKKKEFCNEWEESKKSMKNNKVMNPKTKRTVAIGSRTYKKFDKECKEMKDVKIPKKVKKVETKSADILFCEEIKDNMKNMKDGKVLNPKTNRMVSANSRTFKKMAKDCDKVLEDAKKEEKKPSQKKKTPSPKKKTPTPKKKTLTPEPLTPERSYTTLSESLLDFIKDFEKETGEKNVKETFESAVIESLEEFDDMLNEGLMNYQNFLPPKEGEKEHSQYPSSTDREQKFINKLIKYYKANYEEEGSDVEEIVFEDVEELSEEEDITDIIKSLKPEFDVMKKDLKKKLSKEEKKIDIKKLDKELKEEIENRKQKKIPKKSPPKKKDNQFKSLLEDVKKSKLSNDEINTELKKLKLDNDIEYLKQIILLRLESMV